MHRFGRSAQQKMKDRWGGSFILATVLALGSAWILGNWAANFLSADPATTETTKPPTTAQNGTKNNTAAVGADEFNLYYVQVGSFRSESMAKRAASEYGTKGYATMVAPRNKDGFYQVYAGLFTDKAGAEDIAASLKAEGVNVWTRSEMVHYNPEAIPTAAMGTMKVEVGQGLDMLNVYLHEAARWMEGRALNMPADTAKVSALGKQLGDLAAKMGAGQTDPKMTQLVSMATKASNHAKLLKDASTATTSSDVFQVAMTDYLSLLNEYQAFHSGK